MTTTEILVGIAILDYVKEELLALVPTDDLFLYTNICTVIDRANEKYYLGEETGLTDKEFDTLLEFVVAAEEKWPILRTSNSPTQHVGY